MKRCYENIEYYFCTMQLSQAKKKWIRSLAQKKNRDEEKLFIAEGEKVIADIIRGGNKPRLVVHKSGSHTTLDLFHVETYECDAKDMEAISTMVTPPGVLAVFRQWEFDENVLEQASPRWLIADGIKDPGNMGTLIRTAHWFGINAVIGINLCAELYNPKTIQSTMGSLGKVPVFYLDAALFYEKYGSKTTFFGADLQGKPVGSYTSQESFALVIGSESHGLSEVSTAHLSAKIFIPEFDPGNRPESLNAAVSAGIILSHIAG